jgi:PadR family transcriptional regulator PadR
MDNFRKQFNKGVLELAILRLLTKNDHYGYSLIQEINDKTKGVIEMKDGTLYPILYRLEDQGKIESYWLTNPEGRGKPRKYYKITPLGHQAFEAMLEDYLEINQAVKKLLNE